MKENALFTLLLLLLAAWNPVLAQAPSTDVVKKKDGSTLTGKILSYSPGKTLRLEQPEGQVLEISDSEIAKIQQGIPVDAERQKSFESKQPLPKKVAKTRGLYAVSMLSFAAGSSDNGDLSLGAGFHQVVGYRFHKMFGIGAGFGVDNYSRRGETVYPFFGEVRCFLPSKKPNGNLYALVAGGYSLAFARKTLDITKAEGGPMGHAAIGYRAATTEGIDILIDIGPKFQRASFSRKLYNGDLEERNIDFQRIIVRVGIGF